MGKILIVSSTPGTRLHQVLLDELSGVQPKSAILLATEEEVSRCLTEEADSLVLIITGWKADGVDGEAIVNKAKRAGVNYAIYTADSSPCFLGFIDSTFRTNSPEDREALINHILDVVRYLQYA